MWSSLEEYHRPPNRKVALESLHVVDQYQIQAAEFHMSLMYAPPFAAQFAEVEVDTETGEVRVNRLVFGIDCGQPINPAGPFGAKAAAEIPTDGVAPAVVNAIYDAVGVRLRQIPATPERVRYALQEGGQ